MRGMLRGACQPVCVWEQTPAAAACVQGVGARPGRAVSAFFGYMKASKLLIGEPGEQAAGQWLGSAADRGAVAAGPNARACLGAADCCLSSMGPAPAVAVLCRV